MRGHNNHASRRPRVDENGQGVRTDAITNVDLELVRRNRCKSSDSTEAPLLCSAAVTPCETPPSRWRLATVIITAMLLFCAIPGTNQRPPYVLQDTQAIHRHGWKATAGRASKRWSVERRERQETLVPLIGQADHGMRCVQNKVTWPHPRYGSQPSQTIIWVPTVHPMKITGLFEGPHTKIQVKKSKAPIVIIESTVVYFGESVWIEPPA